MAEVVVVGSINVDVVAQVPKLPQPGETVLGGDLLHLPGGKGANQAVGAAEAGARVRMVACIGDDEVGARYRDGLKAAGVDVSGIRVARGEATGHALIFVDSHGENVIVVAPGANSKLDVGDVEGAAFASGDVVMLQLESPVDVVKAAIAKGQGAGATVILNLSPFQRLDPSALDACDILIVNEVEHSQMLQAGMHHHSVVVTAGSDGARWGDLHAREASVHVVDTTGAGDSFAGAFAAAIAEGCGRQEALTRAVGAGARAVGRMGAQGWSL